MREVSTQSNENRNVAHSVPDRGTYCERQINAKLVVCAVCGKPSYFTDHNQKVHVACSQRP
jgi:hypothetical protein